jgi:hypothetical protein
VAEAESSGRTLRSRSLSFEFSNRTGTPQPAKRLSVSQEGLLFHGASNYLIKCRRNKYDSNSFDVVLGSNAAWNCR